MRFIISSFRWGGSNILYRERIYLSSFKSIHLLVPEPIGFSKFISIFLNIIIISCIE